MNLSHLTTPAARWSHLLAADPDAARDALRALDRAGSPVSVRFVRGRKAETTARFYDELAAALQFPDYFGENWDATNDCLTDLRWLSGGLVLGLLDGDKLLAAAGDDAARKLVQVLTAAAGHWDRPAGKVAARPFHVVVQARPAEADAVAHRWKALGLPLHRL
ncbi:MAG TPA: barstar family protein [Gemmataceae bacterium]|jgi:hypothetical protein